MTEVIAEADDDCVPLWGVQTAQYYRNRFDVPAPGTQLRIDCSEALAAVTIEDAVVVGYLPAHLDYLRENAARERYGCEVQDSGADGEAWVQVRIFAHCDR
jgi:hypothetical protein